jgi:type I site-specific restriction-modification system R (restriction) subunit
MDFVTQLQKFETTIEIDANEIAYARIVRLSTAYLQPMTITSLEEGNKPTTDKFLDFHDAEKNEFLVTNQFELWV